VVNGQGIRGLQPTEPFTHVIVEAVNEFYHPESSLRGGAGKVNRIIAAIRENGPPGLLVTTDDNFGNPDLTIYNRSINADFPDTHPWRVDFRKAAPHPRLIPTRADFRRMVQNNGGFILVSEPLAFTDGEDRGCCTPHKNEIEQMMRSCKREPGCVIVFHKDVEGLTAEKPFPWMPNWNSL
jgi:hypothetical protein